MSGVNLDEALYYQWLINNNSTSTMLNAISGNSEDGGIGSLSSISALSGLDGYSGFGSLSGLGALTGTGAAESVSDFSDILQTYLAGRNTSAATDVTEAATMAGKLNDVLKEAQESGETSSLTYRTVQELYEYFSDQVSSKAAALLGNASSDTSAESVSGSAAGSRAELDEMNQAAQREEEFDFSEFDHIVDSAFAETTPLT